MDACNWERCRLCAGLKHVTELIFVASDIRLRTEILKNLANFPLITVDFSDRTMPDTVCMECFNALRASSNFFKKIKESQVYLRGLEDLAYERHSQRVTELDRVDEEREHRSRRDEGIKIDCKPNRDKYRGKTDMIEMAVSLTQHTKHNNNKMALALEESDFDEVALSYFQCLSCSQTFPTWKDLKVHSFTDNEEFDDRSCTISFNVFGRVAKLKVRKHLHTSRIKVIVCNLCGKGVCKTTMQRHIIFSDQTHSCEKCNKTFETLCRLKKHIKTHDSAHPFGCEKCYRRFKLEGELTEHMVVHTKDFPFSCNTCKKDTSTRMKTHLNTQTGDEDFICSECGMKFTCWTDCNKHARHSHRMTLAKRVMTPYGMILLNQEILKPNQVDLEKVDSKALVKVK